MSDIQAEEATTSTAAINDNNTNNDIVDNDNTNDTTTTKAVNDNHTKPAKLSNRARKRIRAERYNDKYNNRSENDKKESYDKWRLQQSGDDFTTMTLNNDFVNYYKQQNIVPDSEWDTFVSTLSQTLPITFRIGTINALQQQLVHRLTTDGFNLRNKDGSNVDINVDGNIIQPPRPLTWYYDNLAWYINIGKHQLKRVPQLKQFRDFLVGETESGNVTRQEAVSMIPPLLLDIKPHHVVLDMCAAPGSKTGQLLEYLHSDSARSSTVPTGCVIANDADPKRAQMLVHQLQRLGSPNFLVTTHVGQRFPTLYKYKKQANNDDNNNNNTHHTVSTLLSNNTSTTAYTTTTQHQGNESVEPVLFDRILCDVPCSGDGTLRKSPNIFKRWSSTAGNGLHTLQLMIARRSIQLLKPGGIIVYSTCSFNPIENEAVVAELIRRSNYTLELLDMSNKLPGLIREPGLTNWTVFSRNDIVTYDASQHTRLSRIKPSFFPPHIIYNDSNKLHLQRCIRILPHKQNTGAFFIAVLRKPENINNSNINNDINNTVDDEADLQDADNANVNELAVDDADNNNISQQQQSQNNHNCNNNKNKKSTNKGNFNRDDDFMPMDPIVSKQLIDFFGLPSTINTSNFWSRSTSNKRVFFLAPYVSDILSCNNNNNRIKTVNAGSRCFEYNKTRYADILYKCSYRLAQEAVDYILPYMSKQIVYCEFKAFKTLLTCDNLLIKSYTQDNNSILSQSIQNVQPGCVVCVLRSIEAEKLSSRYNGIAVTAWMTLHSIQLMISKEWKYSLHNLLDNYNNNSNNNNNNNNSIT